MIVYVCYWASEYSGTSMAVLITQYKDKAEAWVACESKNAQWGDTPTYEVMTLEVEVL